RSPSNVAGLGDGLAAGAAASVFAGAPPAFRPSTSALTIRPLGPEPLIAERSIFLSSAIRLAIGETAMPLSAPFVRNEKIVFATPESSCDTSGLGVSRCDALPTSSFVILPAGPVPDIVARSMLSSFANRRADGVDGGVNDVI